LVTNWKDVGTPTLFRYCKVWRSRQEIQKTFELSNVQSWHLVKWMAKLHGDIIVKKGQGDTKRGYMYKTRIASLETLELEQSNNS